MSDTGPTRTSSAAGQPVVADVLRERNAPKLMLTHPSFIRRKAEFKELGHRLAKAIAGRGGLLILVGKSGSGKSRTVEEFADRVELRASKMAVMRGRCYQGQSVPRYGPLAEALTEYVNTAELKSYDNVGDGAPDLAWLVPTLARRLPHSSEPTAPRSREERLRIFEAVSRFLIAASANARLLITLDDLQWADDDTIAMLQHIAAAIARHPILIVGAYRGAKLNPKHPLAGCEQIEISGLDSYHAGQLLAAAARRDVPDLLVKPIAKESDGNPSLILEALLLLAQEGIDGLS
jgi:predicted ATPase